jgi:predicted CXXCH cytochrome family protein
MKRFVARMLTVAVGLSVASPVLAYTGSYPPGAGINGTVHDLSTVHNGMNYVASPADPLKRICIFCHAPHNTYRLSTATGGSGPQAPDAFDYLPLWNHQLQANYNYTMYENGPGAPTEGPQASQAILNGMTPGSSSLLCLSCHDGSVAVNQYGNVDQPITSQSGGGLTISSQYQIGKDKYLGNHHPIGFNYDSVQVADPGIRNADTAMLTPTTFVRDHLLGTGNQYMECDTCHSVHNKGNTGERLLWRSDQNSELCLTCHDKGIYTAP